MPTNKTFDLLCMGRSSIDLYSNNPGSPFEQIESFGAFVGGSPLNIATQVRRLGKKPALLTAVGQDQVGNFILHFLKEEGIHTDYIPVLPERRSSAVVLGIEPPDKFPLVYYRDNCADSFLTIDHVLAANISQFEMLEISATACNQEPTRSASFFAVEEANAAGVPVVLDLDFRSDQWYDPRAFGITLRALLPRVTIAIGTEEEILATALTESSQVTIKHQQISAPEISGDLEGAIQMILSKGVEALVVKRGSQGASYFLKNGAYRDVPGFPVEVLNILGAGDAFAGGFIYGYLQGKDWYESCRLGNACGALVVTRHGCANFMPTVEEVNTFVESRGGL